MKIKQLLNILNNLDKNKNIIFLNSQLVSGSDELMEVSTIIEDDNNIILCSDEPYINSIYRNPEKINFKILYGNIFEI